jgi:5-methyltetrahydrofolate--homocysteine methyltransferase
MTISSRPGGAAPDFRAALAGRVMVADGATGTTLPGSSAAISDFDGHEGCNEVLSVTRQARYFSA